MPEAEAYSMALALQDYVPVILSGLGLFFIARMVAKMEPAAGMLGYAGVALITAGGVSKATWKLILALTAGQTNVVVLDQFLFYGLSSGFILVTFALFYGQRRVYADKPAGNVWLWPLLTAGLTVGTALFVSVNYYDPTRTGQQMWFFILLGMTTLFNILALGLATGKARHNGLWLAAVLFLVNLVGIILLQGLARIPSRVESLQWVQQGLNTLCQLALILGAWQLSRVTVQRLQAKFSGGQSSSTASANA